MFSNLPDTAGDYSTLNNTPNHVAERFPEFLALVFKPEFMNSAGKEVLMDMAEQRHLLPVYRSDKL